MGIQGTHLGRTAPIPAKAFGRTERRIGITYQMLIKDVDAEEIISDLMGDHDMTVSDLLDIYGIIRSIRDIFLNMKRNE